MAFIEFIIGICCFGDFYRNVNWISDYEVRGCA